MQKKSPNRRRRQYSHSASTDKATVSFEGRVVETFPGPSFNVEVTRKNDLPPILIKCNLKSMLIKRKVLIIKGDFVLVEVNLEDMATEDKVIKGLIVQRK
jgi:translation initiation factor IF-1